MDEKVIIIGAGLCGALLALRLAQKGYSVIVYERRPDMKKETISAGRSINLALSDRGLKGLELVGIKDDVEALIIPMHGRMIHPLSGSSTFVNYSGRQGEWINSISRSGLNMLLLDRAEATGKVKFVFNVECQEVNFSKGELVLQDTINEKVETVNGDLIFGTDGANSAIRNAMLQASAKYRFDFSLKYLSTGYKELEIPSAINGGFRLEKNALHIWPRQGFMMIALPNLDGSFTVTLFLPFEGQHCFSKLTTQKEIMAFFADHFPSALSHMPDIFEDFSANPTSSLGTVKCYPWQINGSFLLMGDAAHAVVPFYGQGMNASFEDVVILDELMDRYNGDWKKILPEYQHIRKKDTDAIADLAVENEYEMRDATANPIFLLKRKIELHLEQNHPDYFSKYSMVTFREDLPYSVAMEKGRKQDAILMEYAGSLENIDEVDYAFLLDKLKKI